MTCVVLPNGPLILCFLAQSVPLHLLRRNSFLRCGTEYFYYFNCKSIKNKITKNSAAFSASLRISKAKSANFKLIIGISPAKFILVYLVWSCTRWSCTHSCVSWNGFNVTSLKSCKNNLNRGKLYNLYDHFLLFKSI